MTNNERCEFLLREAKENLAEMESAFQKGLWNRTIRRAQEVVEQSLKAVIKLMNAEYPKEHDVSRVFEEVLKKRKISFNQQDIEQIKEVSALLAQKRAPAFYGEVIFSKEEAIQAKQGALKVLEFVEKFIDNFKPMP